MAFLLSAVMHQVSDVTWHALDVDQGFLETMGKVVPLFWSINHFVIRDRGVLKWFRFISDDEIVRLETMGKVGFRGFGVLRGRSIKWIDR